MNAFEARRIREAKREVKEAKEGPKHSRQMKCNFKLFLNFSFATEVFLFRQFFLEQSNNESNCVLNKKLFITCWYFFTVVINMGSIIFLVLFLSQNLMYFDPK